jgi:alpha-mannosidase
VPALGYAVIDAARRPRFEPPEADAARLENDKVRLRFNLDGSIGSLFDKEHGREVLAPKEGGNVLAVYRDTGDAWDIPMDYRDRTPERPQLESTEIIEDGPRAGVRHRYRFGRSTIIQEVVLVAGSRRLDFATSVDWHESERMLRTAFAVDISTREANCGIQFGSIRRPTHSDTPADFAKFEVCAHKWVDLSGHDYGVALLNDCKYGHHLRGNLLDLNLLRSPNYPDPQADRGIHEFTYSLYPHAGGHVAGGVVRAAYELNMQLRPLTGAAGAGPLPPSGSWLRPEVPDIIIETVKQAEDGNGLIVRLYEAAGVATETMLHAGFDLAAVQVTDLIEQDPAPVPAAGSDLPLALKPFEIRTLCLVPGRQ